MRRIVLWLVVLAAVLGTGLALRPAAAARLEVSAAPLQTWTQSVSLDVAPPPTEPEEPAPSAPLWPAVSTEAPAAAPPTTTPQQAPQDGVTPTPVPAPSVEPPVAPPAESPAEPAAEPAVDEPAVEEPTAGD